VSCPAAAEPAGEIEAGINGAPRRLSGALLDSADGEVALIAVAKDETAPDR